MDDKEGATSTRLDIFDGQIGERALFRHDYDLNRQAEIAQGALQFAHACRLADEARGFRDKNHLGNTLGTDMRRQNHLVGAGMQQLAFGGHRIAARDDLDVPTQAACAQGDEDVGRVVG